MDGLEDQAEAALAGLLEQLRLHPVVEIGHSSRDTVLFSICEAIRSTRVIATSLVFRSGISLAGLAMLQQALQENDTICELQFVSLKSCEEVKEAINCCRHQPRIHSLSLKNYTTNRRAERESIAVTIGDAVFGSGGIPTLKTLEIVRFPIGTRGTQILTEAMAIDTHLTTLRMIDCDLRSDSASFVAHMIKTNHHLQELDLSFNPHYLGSGITRELMLKTLVQRGLRFNTSLIELKLEQTGGGPIKRSLLDRQLQITKFRAAFVRSNRSPFDIPQHMWPHILEKVAFKPTILHQFLQEAAITLFC